MSDGTKTNVEAGRNLVVYRRTGKEIATNYGLFQKNKTDFKFVKALNTSVPMRSTAVLIQHKRKQITLFFVLMGHHGKNKCSSLFLKRTYTVCS